MGYHVHVLTDAFWSKVDKFGPVPSHRPDLGPCHLWTGARTDKGYGNLRGVVSHILSWSELNGPVPEGLELDHLCRVRHCVNPDHLEAVTHMENCRRGREAAGPTSTGHRADGYFLPRLLRFARTRAGLSQRELAVRCDVVQPSVVAWESGRRATSEETLTKVAHALGHADVERFLCSEVPEWMRRATEPPAERRTT